MASASEVYSREDILRFVEYMTGIIKTDEFKQAVKDATRQEPVPANEDALMDIYEKIQARVLANYIKGDQSTNAALSCNVDAESIAIGVQAMDQVRHAAERYPDDEVEKTITEMCVLIEGHVVELVSNSPHLKHIMKEKEDELEQAKGATMNPMPEINQETVNMLQFAMSTLTPEQRTTMQRVQGAMMLGKSVSAEDQHAMMEIQQHISAFIRTMSQFNKPTPAAV